MTSYAIIGMAISPILVPFLLTVGKVACLAVLSLFNIQFVTLGTTINKVICDRALKRLSESNSSWAPNKEIDGKEITIGDGLVCNTQFKIIGWIVKNTTPTQYGTETNTTFYMLCRVAGRKQLLEPEKAEETDKKVKIEGSVKTLWGHAWHKKWHEEEPSQEKYITTPSQTRIVDNISKEISFGGCFLVHGSPGTGKTNIANMVQQHLFNCDNKCKPIIVRGYNPTKPGNFLQEVLSKCTPTEETPVIITFDEFDKVVQPIQDGIKEPEQFAIEVTTKDTFAPYLDKIATIPYLIVIATSNETLEWWDHIERKYITRPGRFVGKYSMEPLSIEDAEECFNIGKKIYNLPDLVLPNFKSMSHLVTIAILSDAFKRCHGNDDEFQKRISKTN
jgi:hypothetical protein